jgi:opacity protein-like surface antigen
MKLKDLVGVGMLAAPVAAASAASAQATVAPPTTETTSYVSVSVGSISGTDYSYTVENLFPVEAEMGDGYIIEAAFGRRFGDNWRGEIAVSWRDHNNATTSWVFGSNLTGPGVSAYTLDAIGYYDFRPDAPANFYIGAGLGIGSVTVDDGVIADSTGAGLHIQGVAGMEARLNSTLKVFAEARVRSLLPSIETGTAGASAGVEDTFDITTASIQAGVKFIL